MSNPMPPTKTPSEVKHTPLPWKADWCDLWHHGVDYRDEADPHLYTGISIVTALKDSPIAHANLALIVQAVNSHAQLVAAARAAKEFIECVGGLVSPDDWKADVLSQLTTALGAADASR